jgi:hypothetical protein
MKIYLRLWTLAIIKTRCFLWEVRIEAEETVSYKWDWMQNWRDSNIAIWIY